MQVGRRALRHLLPLRASAADKRWPIDPAAGGNRWRLSEFWQQCLQLLERGVLWPVFGGLADQIGKPPLIVRMSHDVGNVDAERFVPRGEIVKALVESRPQELLENPRTDVALFERVCQLNE